MVTVSELKSKIIDDAVDNENFRAQLLADPKSAIQDKTGVVVPDEFNIKVHEDSKTTAHLVLPPSPELTPAEMELVAAGFDWDFVTGG